MHLRLIVSSLIAAIRNRRRCRRGKQQYPPSGNYPPANQNVNSRDRPNAVSAAERAIMHRRANRINFRRNSRRWNDARQPGTPPSRLPPTAPFTLTPQEQQDVARVLIRGNSGTAG